MAGILKVEQLVGPTSGVNANAVNIPGHIVQVHEFHSTAAVTINSSQNKPFETSITTKFDNSDILVILNVGRSSYNQDTDMCLAMGWRAGSLSGTPSDYNSLHGSSYSRQTVPGLGSFWSQDTSEPGGGTWNGGYNISSINFIKKHSPAQPAGTQIYYALWGGSDGTFYLGRSHSGGTDNGYDTSILLMEIGA
jgi:hypothetical protein